MLDKLKIKNFYTKNFFDRKFFGTEHARSRRLGFLKKVLKTCKKEARILEVGCASGRMMQNLSKDFNIIGMDLSKELLSKSKDLYKVVNADAEQLPFKKNQFDIVYSFELIEHLPHPNKFLKGVIGF